MSVQEEELPFPLPQEQQWGQRNSSFSGRWDRNSLCKLWFPEFLLNRQQIWVLQPQHTFRNLLLSVDLEEKLISALNESIGQNSSKRTTCQWTQKSLLQVCAQDDQQAVEERHRELTQTFASFHHNQGLLGINSPMSKKQPFSSWCPLDALDFNSHHSQPA